MLTGSHSLNSRHAASPSGESNQMGHKKDESGRERRQISRDRGSEKSSVVSYNKGNKIQKAE